MPTESEFYRAVVREHLERHQAGVIATVGPGGSLHQSVVRYVMDGEDILISTESSRVKARHVAAGGRVSLCVMSGDAPYAGVTVHGTGRIEQTGIADATQRILSAMGVDRTETDESLAAKGRVILRITPSKVLTAWL